MKKEKATFGAGCFWGVEEIYRKTLGVFKTSVGYTGGDTKDPSYREVCYGKTNHAEVVQIEFNSLEVSYDTLLQIFWEIHDPTTLNRQGPDVGTQYRSVIFFHSPSQQKSALKSKDFFDMHNIFSSLIVTEILEASDYYIAEKDHQQYLLNTGRSSCHRRRTLPLWSMLAKEI